MCLCTLIEVVEPVNVTAMSVFRNINIPIFYFGTIAGWLLNNINRRTDSCHLEKLVLEARLSLLDVSIIKCKRIKRLWIISKEYCIQKKKKNLCYIAFFCLNSHWIKLNVFSPRFECLQPEPERHSITKIMKIRIAHRPTHRNQSRCRDTKHPGKWFKF